MAYDVSALRKSIALLEILAGSDEALGVTELARRAGLAKNMAFRVCQTLVDLGWLEAVDDAPRYRLTLVPLHLFSRPLERAELSTAVHQPLRALRAATGHTAYAAVRDGHRAINVQVLEGGGPLRVAGGLGAAFPLHATSQGKVLLAFDPAAWADLPSKLEAHTAKTVTAKRILKQELDAIRREGLAWNREEYAPGLIGCAAPVVDQDGACLAAIGVFAPLAGGTQAELERLFAPAVRTAAQQASARLGA